MFEASEVAIQFVITVRPIVEAVAERDAGLADQLKRAANGTALLTAEAGCREGRDRRYRARMAAGEAAEAITALRLVAAWGWAPDAAIADARALADRVKAMLWRLAHPRR
jgi:four helix bundle protein